MSIGRCLKLFLLFNLGIFLTCGFLPEYTIGLISPQTGTIKGRVIDAEVKSPIPDVKVTLSGFSATYTDEQGYFSFSPVPVGNYTLEFFVRFYKPRAVPDVIVKSQRISNLETELQLDLDMQEKEEVNVTAGYFSSSEQQPSSAASFSYEEIRRSAGSAGDVSRIISGLPSVARVNDMLNSLVVRGGSPAENAFYIDNIEIPNINHYPILGSSAGPLGLLNVDFIRDVSFYSGGFSAAYGNRLSSIMDISFREGNRDETDLQFDLSMMGIGMVAEGPLGRDKGSWMFSARRSYIDLLIKLMGQGVPVSYSDFQGKAVLDLSTRSRLTLLGVLGVDESGTEKEDALKDGEPFYGGLDTVEYTAGLNWFMMWGEKGYSNTSLALSATDYSDNAFDTVTESLSRQGENTEKIITLRNDNFYRFDQYWKINFGVETRRIMNDYAYSIGAYTDVLGRHVALFNQDIHIGSYTYAAFFNLTAVPFSSLTLNLGLRTDHYTYNRHSHIAPRLSLSWQLSPRTSLEAAGGIFYQHLPLILLSQQNSFKELKDPLAYHLVLGLRHMLTGSTCLTLEIYDKEYRNFPMDPSQPALFIFDEVYYSGHFSPHAELHDSGRARSYGLEFMIQKKLAEKIYGVISASYFRTRYRGHDLKWRNRVYDNRFIFAVEGGYKPNKNWDMSLKCNYAGGIPYTPFDETASMAVNSGIYSPDSINSRRLPAYFSVNVRADRRFHFGSSNLTVYLSLWNVLNRKNAYAYYWNTIERHPDYFYGWGLLPAIGIEFEF